MEKEMNEKKKTKSITKKAKKIRSIVMMSLLCVLMLSAATYAWFTLSDTAKIANLSMTVGETSGLQIAKDNDGNAGTFGGSIEFDTVIGNLKPATSSDGLNFKYPEYDEDGNVKELKPTTASLPVANATNSTEGYYIEYAFWLKSLGKASDVKIATGSISPATGKYDSSSGSYSGTYILSNAVDTTKAVPGSAAVRMSFKNIANTLLAVYEPNSDITNDNFNLVEKEDYAVETADVADEVVVSSTIKHNSAGNVADNMNTTLIHLEANTPTKIIMYIWIEGKDAQCANQIAAKEIVGQLLFTNATN